MGSDDDDYADIAYDKIVGHSELAIKFIIEEEEVWVPKSCIDSIWMGEFQDCLDRGTAITMLGDVPVLERFAISKGLV